MKKTKNKLAFLVLSLSAISLACCDNNAPEEKCPPHNYGEWVVETEATESAEGKRSAECSKCHKKKTETIPALGFERTIIFKNAAGTEISNTKVRSIDKIEKPADPTAPEGMVFYGWANVKNGGQIWNFDDKILGLAAFDAEFEPVFVPANVNPQYLEGELYSEIVNKKDDKGNKVGWKGATYSGGAQGAQLIYKDKGSELGSGCHINSFNYYRDTVSDKDVLGTAPDEKDQKTYDPAGENIGYFVHFNYEKGNTFVWNINSDKAVSDATIFMRISAEYGLLDTTTKLQTLTFSDSEFPLKVNDTKLEYGTIKITNIPPSGNSILPMQDYLVGVNVSLKEGANTITLAVDNDKQILGTVFATAPCFDCLKIYTSATITWEEADPLNLLAK